MVKVICAGAPKTGTKSMARALRILGYNEVYDYEESIEFGFDEWEKVLLDKEQDVQKVIEKVYAGGNVEAVVDFPHALFFDEFLKRWPDAKVILMMRDEDAAWRSFERMMIDAQQRPVYKFIMFFKCILPTARRFDNWLHSLLSSGFGFVNVWHNELKWKKFFRRHNCYVQSVVPPQQLLVYRIDEGWGPLCKFLEMPQPAVDFPFENKGGEKGGIVDRVENNLTITRKAKREAIIVLTSLPIVISLIFYYLITFLF